jgi:hypothetical protein
MIVLGPVTPLAAQTGGTNVPLDVTEEASRLTMRSHEGRLVDVLEAIGRQADGTHVPLDVTEEASRLTVRAHEGRLADVLEAIGRQAGGPNVPLARVNRDAITAEELARTNQPARANGAAIRAEEMVRKDQPETRTNQPETRTNQLARANGAAITAEQVVRKNQPETSTNQPETGTNQPGTSNEGDVLDVTVKGSRLTVRAHEVRLADVLKAIGRQAGMRIVLKGDLNAPVTDAFTDLPLGEGIRRVARWHSVVLVYDPSPGTAQGVVLTAVWVTGSSSGPGRAEPAARAGAGISRSR